MKAPPCPQLIKAEKCGNDKAGPSNRQGLFYPYRVFMAEDSGLAYFICCQEYGCGDDQSGYCFSPVQAIGKRRMLFACCPKADPCGSRSQNVCSRVNGIAKKGRAARLDASCTLYDGQDQVHGHRQGCPFSCLSKFH